MKKPFRHWCFHNTFSFARRGRFRDRVVVGGHRELTRCIAPSRAPSWLLVSMMSKTVGCCNTQSTSSRTLRGPSTEGVERVEKVVFNNVFARHVFDDDAPSKHPPRAKWVNSDNWRDYRSGWRSFMRPEWTTNLISERVGRSTATALQCDTKNQSLTLLLQPLLVQAPLLTILMPSIAKTSPLLRKRRR